MKRLIAAAALAAGALGLGTACDPSFADVLRIDCTAPGWFSVQVSTTTGYAEVRTGTGHLVGRVTEPGTQRVAVQDWHPTRGGHIEKLLVTAGSARSGSATTPFCGVVLEPEESDVPADA